MSWDAIVQTALGGTGITVVVAVIRQILQRRSLAVSDVQVLSTTAMEQVKSITGEMTTLKADMVAVRAALRAHEVWDRKILKVLDDNHIDYTAVGPAPDLWV